MTSRLTAFVVGVTVFLLCVSLALGVVVTIQNHTLLEKNHTLSVDNRALLQEVTRVHTDNETIEHNILLLCEHIAVRCK